MEQWAKLARFEGDEATALERMQTFHSGGYKAFLKLDVRRSEATGDYGSAAGDYAMLGEAKRTLPLPLLKRHFAKRSKLVFIKANPAYDNIRSDPRFANILRRMGLPQ